MKEAINFFGNNRDSTLSKINTVLPGVIVSFDATRQVADITLSTGVTITEVRAMCFLSGNMYIKLPYKKGDNVIVAFAQEDIDNFVYGSDATPSQKKFRLDDAFMLGSFAVSRQTINSTDDNAIEIGSSNGSKIVISDSYIDLIGEVRVNGTPL